MQWQGTEAVRSGRFFFARRATPYPDVVAVGRFFAGSGRRRRLAMLAGSLVLASTISSATLAFAVASNSGPGRALVNVVKERIGPNEELHYSVHTVLGHVFAVCPCTQGLARLEYAKAAYHRPPSGR
jgi:hypothetical protein